MKMSAGPLLHPNRYNYCLVDGSDKLKFTCEFVMTHNY